MVVKLSRSVWKSINLYSSAAHQAPAPAEHPAPAARDAFLHVPTARAPGNSHTDDTALRASSDKHAALLPMTGHPDAPSPLSVSSPFLTDCATLASPSLNLSSSTLVNPELPLIGIHEFAPLRVLGEGGFGKVYQVQDKATGKHYALKVIQKSRLKSSSYKLVRREQRVLRAIAGDRVFLRLYASWHDTENFYLVTEFFPRGDLRVDMRRAKKYRPDVARLYTAEILFALEKLHRVGIIHRDVKPENVLFDADGHLVLADFGLAKMFSFDFKGGQSVKPDGLQASGLGRTEDITRSACGTLRYMAPEALEGRPYSYGVDLWAVGVVLHMMLCGQSPYGAGVQRKDFKEAVLTTDLVFRPGELDPLAQDVLRKLLTKDPEARSSLAEVKAHPYFAKINWEALESGEQPALRLPSSHGGMFAGLTNSLEIKGGSSYTASDDPYPEFTFISSEFRGNQMTVAIKYLEAPTPTAELAPLSVTLFPGTDAPLLPAQLDEKRWQFKMFLLKVFRQHAEHKADEQLQDKDEPSFLALDRVHKNANGFSAWTTIRHDSLLDALAQVDEAEDSQAFGVFERLRWWFRRHRIQAVRRGGSRALDLDL